MKYFKLILEHGDCSLSEIEVFSQIYSQAGTDIFDISPDIKALKATKRGIKKAGLNPCDFKYCISFGTNSLNSMPKATINQSKCKRCYKCISRCSQNAIFIDKNGYPKVSEDKCIGCKTCKKSCIDFLDKEVDIKQVAKDFEGEKLDIVEFHISGYNKKTIIQKWEQLLENFSCQKSIAVERNKFGDEKLLKLVKKLDKMNPQKTIIEAYDTSPNPCDTPAGTLQAIAHAQIYEKLGLPVFISGETNSFTKDFADKFDVKYSGISMNTYARKIIEKALSASDYELAVRIAKKLVEKIKT